MESIQDGPQPVSPVRPKVPVIQAEYFGRNGDVLKLHIANLFLNIITLGVYSFWGKTRIRRYTTSHISIAQDRFEYTGTGKELMVGAMKASLIFIPLVILMGVPFVNILAYPAFFAVLSVAVFMALRYRLSRARWRGIRFSLGGSVKEYFILAIKRTGMNIITLGWRIPESDILKWSYIANNMKYGDLSFSFQGDDSRLMAIHKQTLLIGVGLMVGSSILVGIGMHEPTHVLIALIGYLGFLGAVLVRIWYGAALWHEKFRGLRLGSLRFKMDVDGKTLAKLVATNILLVVFTLGLAKPIVINRNIRYFVSRFKIGGDINELIAEQSKASTKGTLGDALAADVGFDLGM
jgi:uncharacterized membrane protein YjgN (DUF898 family)